MTYKDLLTQPKHDMLQKKIGKASSRNIDKTGVFYHVITKSSNGDGIFMTKGAGEYRHTLLCRLCEERGITILFSVTMPTHTHDVFLTPDWKLMCEVLAILDTNVSKFIRKNNPQRYTKGTKPLRRHPVYIVVRDILYLMVLGKYIYENMAGIRKENRFVPHECFWMFRSGRLPDGYDEKLYPVLFGMSMQELFELYSNKTKQEVYDYACKVASGWSKKKTEAIFFKEKNQTVRILESTGPSK